MGWISNSSLIPVYMIHLPTVYVCSKFQSSWPHSSWEKSDEKFQCWKLERKTNEEIKGWISSSSLIPVYTISLPTVHVCTKFQSSRPQFPRKVWPKIYMLTIEEKENEEIKGQMRAAAWFQYTWYICPQPRCVPSFNLLGLAVPKKSVTKNSNVWKVNWTWRFHNTLHVYWKFNSPTRALTPKWLIRTHLRF